MSFNRVFDRLCTTGLAHYLDGTILIFKSVGAANETDDICWLGLGQS